MQPMNEILGPLSPSSKMNKPTNLSMALAKVLKQGCVSLQFLVTPGTYPKSSVGNYSNIPSLTKTETRTLPTYIALTVLSISFIHHFTLSAQEHRKTVYFLCLFEQTSSFVATQRMCSAISHNLITVSQNSPLWKIIHSFILSSVHSSMVNLRATQSHASATRDPLQSRWKVCEQASCVPLIIHRLNLEVSQPFTVSTGETKGSLQGIVLVFTSTYTRADSRLIITSDFNIKLQE